MHEKTNLTDTQFCDVAFLLAHLLVIRKHSRRRQVYLCTMVFKIDFGYSRDFVFLSHLVFEFKAPIVRKGKSGST